MGLVEAADVINEPHPSHFRADRLQHPGSELVFIAEWLEERQELPFRILEFNEDSQKYLLVLPIPEKQQTCHLIESSKSTNLVGVKLDLCARDPSHPTLFVSNMASERV